MGYALWCLAVLYGGRVDALHLEHHRKLMLEWAALGQAKLYLYLLLGFGSQENGEHRALYFCFAASKKNALFPIWDAACLSMSGFCNCWHFIVTWQRLVGKLEKNYVYLSKKLLFDKWKTKNWTKARKICCEEKYLVVAHKNHPNRWSATWSKIKESSYEYRYPSYLICETRACIPASVWVIAQI